MMANGNWWKQRKLVYVSYSFSCSSLVPNFVVLTPTVSTHEPQTSDLSFKWMVFGMVSVDKAYKSLGVFSSHGVFGVSCVLRCKSVFTCNLPTALTHIYKAFCCCWNSHDLGTCLEANWNAYFKCKYISLVMYYSHYLAEAGTVITIRRSRIVIVIVVIVITIYSSWRC